MTLLGDLFNADTTFVHEIFFLEKVLRVSSTDGVFGKKNEFRFHGFRLFYGSNNKILIFGNISDVVVDLRYRYFHNSARCIP